jgi:xanthine dehydrogenase FAD-binding subunit
MRAVLKPACREELFSHLERFPQAMVMAGGTDLLVRLRQAPAPNRRPLLLLAGLPELRGIHDRGTEISIGAATPLARLIRHPLALGHAALLVRAASTIGGPAVRNMATLGGNISTASPAGDSLPALQLLGAELELASRHGTRRLAVGDFVSGPGRTRLRHGEVITRILLPRGEDLPCQTFQKVGLRSSLAVAVVSFAGMLRFSPDGCVREARFAWGSVAPTVVRLPGLEEKLAGAPLDRDSIRAAAALVREGVSPMDDIRGSAEYRRSVAANLLVRFLEGIHA